MKYRVDVRSRRKGGADIAAAPAMSNHYVIDISRITERPAKWPRFVRMKKIGRDYWVSFDPTDTPDADTEWFRLERL